MKKSPLFFVLSNTQIHSFFPESKFLTVISEKVKVSDNKIEIDSGIYPLFCSLKEAMNSIADKLEGKYVFVDDEGVVHNVDKSGISSTYLSESGRMKIKIEDVIDDGFPRYTSVRFIDPEGLITDQGDHVLWEPKYLARELDESYTELSL